MSSFESGLVRKKEFARKLNVGNTKFWELQKVGLIPPPVHLPMLNGKPGRVCYWPGTVVDEVLRVIVNHSPCADRFLNDPFGRSAMQEAQ